MLELMLPGLNKVKPNHLLLLSSSNTAPSRWNIIPNGLTWAVSVKHVYALKLCNYGLLRMKTLFLQTHRSLKSSSASISSPAPKGRLNAASRWLNCFRFRRRLRTTDGADSPGTHVAYSFVRPAGRSAKTLASSAWQPST